MNSKPSQQDNGFTLIELMVVISIIAILASIGMVLYSNVQKNARDTRRLVEMESLSKALMLYQLQHGAYPAVNPAAQDVGGWEVSYKNGFLSSLMPDYQEKPVVDPINQLDVGFDFFGPKAGSYFYAYYFYSAANAQSYGCSFNEPFAVIAVRQLENGRQSNTPKATCGTMPSGGCPQGGITNTCRDWSTEFDYSQLLRLQ